MRTLAQRKAGWGSLRSGRVAEDKVRGRAVRAAAPDDLVGELAQDDVGLLALWLDRGPTAVVLDQEVIEDRETEQARSCSSSWSYLMDVPSISRRASSKACMTSSTWTSDVGLLALDVRLFLLVTSI
jgi:hypothetical protein